MIRPVLVVAAAELQEGLRNRWVTSAILLLALLAFSLALLGSAPIGETRASALSVTTVSLASLSVYLVPLIALMLSYDAIVGERERGTLLLLLTYPISRGQVIVGKFLGHVVIMSAAILLGYGSTGLYIAVISDPPAAEWILFAAMLGSSLLLAGVFTALGYLISVLVSSRATAAGYAIGFWLYMVVIFDLLLLGVVLTDSSRAVSTNWFSVIMLSNPADLYRLFNLAGSESAKLVTGAVGVLDGSILSSTTLLVCLCLWLLVPLAASIWIFKRHEL